MDKEILLKETMNKINKVNLVLDCFFSNDFNKLKSSKFKFTILSLNSLLVRVGFINNGIIDAYSSENFYVINILKRVLIEAYFKHLYIYTRSLKENSDNVGKEYIKTCKSSEDLSAIKLFSNYTKESNIILDIKDTEWSFGGEENKNIIEISKKFDLKQIFHELLKGVGDDNVVKNIFRDEFFKKYIREYAESSSFIHAGPYSNEVYNIFQTSKNKNKILDKILLDSFSLYENTVRNTFLFFSLVDPELDIYYKLINNIFTKNTKKKK